MPVARPEGLVGLSVEEVAVRGVLRAGDRSVGLLQALTRSTTSSAPAIACEMGWSRR